MAASSEPDEKTKSDIQMAEELWGEPNWWRFFPTRAEYNSYLLWMMAYHDLHPVEVAEVTDTDEDGDEEDIDDDDDGAIDWEEEYRLLEASEEIERLEAMREEAYRNVPDIEMYTDEYYREFTKWRKKYGHLFPAHVIRKFHNAKKVYDMLMEESAAEARAEYEKFWAQPKRW